MIMIVSALDAESVGLTNGLLGFWIESQLRTQKGEISKIAAI